MARTAKPYYTATDDYMHQQLAEGRRRLAKRSNTFTPPAESPHVRRQREANDRHGAAMRRQVFGGK